jgi:hypothetical protein
MPTTKTPDIYIDERRVRKNHITYLEALETLSQSEAKISSNKIIQYLKRSRGAFDTIRTLEGFNYIESTETRPNKSKNWKLTPIGEEILRQSRAAQ